MVIVKELKIAGKDLMLGFRGKSVHFRHKAYKDRRPDRQKNMENHIISIFKIGVKNPLVTWRNHVLLGMSRHEIMMKFNPDYVFACWEIQEDVNEWTRNDLEKLEYLKGLMWKPDYREFGYD